MADNLSLSIRINVDGKDASVKFADVGRAVGELNKKLVDLKAAARAADLKGDDLGALAAREMAKEIGLATANLERLKQAAKLDHARDLLDVRPFRDIQREIDQARAAFERLQASGKLSGAELGQAYSHLQTRIVELKAQTNGWAESFSHMRGQIAAVVGAFAGIAGAVKIAAGFETAMVDFARATGQTKEEAMGLADEFRQMAQTYGMTAAAIAGIATIGGKMGIAREELSDFVRTVAQAAINFDMLPEEAGKALATLSAVLKVPVKELDAFAGAINAISDSVGVMERDVIDAMTRAGASAQALGLSREQAAAMAAAMIRLGANSETAGSSIRTFSMRLRGAIGDSGEAGRALKNVVGDVRAFAQLLYTDGQAAVSKFFGALNRMPAPERFAALKAIFQEGLDTETIAKLAEGVETYGKALEAAGGDAEKFRRQLADLTGMKLGTTEAAFRNLWQAVRNLADVFGQRLLPLVKAVTLALNGVADALRAAAGAAPWLSTVATILGAIALAAIPLRALFGGIVLLLGRIGLSAGGIGLVAAAFTFLGLAVKRAFWPLAALSLAVDAGIWAWDKFGKTADDAAQKNDAALRKLAESGSKAATEIKAALDTVASIVSDRLTAATERAGTAIKSLTDGYRDATAIIKSQLDRQLADVEAAGRDRAEMARRTARSEAQEIATTTRAVIDTEWEKISVVEDSARKMLMAWERTHREATRMARAAGQDTTAIERQSAEARIAIYSQLESAYRATIDRLIAEEQRHVDAARRADEELARFKMSTEDRVRALRQRGMDDYAAYQDRIRQADEKTAQAREALQKGDFERARQLAEQAVGLYEANAREVTRRVEQNGKSVTETVVSQASASARAIEKIGEASKVVEQALQGQGNAHKAAAREASAGAADAARELAKVAETVTALQAELAKGIDLKISADAASLRDAVTEIGRLKEAAAGIEAAKKAVADMEEALKRAKDAGAAIEVNVKVGDVEKIIAAARAKVEAAGIEANVTFDNAGKALSGFRSELEQLSGVRTTSQHAVDSNAQQARAEIDSLNGRNTHSSHTIHVYQQQHYASGGLVGGYASGGAIRGPGTATSDSIPAMLSNGEFVLRAQAVKKWGLDFLSALNAGILPALPMPAFAAGGLAGVSGSPSPSSGGEEITLNLAIGGRDHKVRSSRETAMALAQALRELSRAA